MTPGELIEKWKRSDRLYKRPDSRGIAGAMADEIRAWRQWEVATFIKGATERKRLLAVIAQWQPPAEVTF